MADDLSTDQILAELLDMGFEFDQVTEAIASVGPHRDSVLERLLNPARESRKQSQSRPASSLKQPSIKDHISRLGGTKRKHCSTSVCGIASEKETRSLSEPKDCEHDNKIRFIISSSDDIEKKSFGPGQGSTVRESISKEASKGFVEMGNKLKNDISDAGACEEKPGVNSNSSGSATGKVSLVEEASYNCKTENRTEAILQKYFGFGSLKSFQKEALETWSSNEDCIVLAATGSGKSLCFQIPALLTDKVVVVISPLISLMHDQCLKLATHGIAACFLGSGQPDTQVEKKAMQGAYKIVYVCPETVVRLMDPLKRLAESPGIALFAIDEAHCVSKWGHDFRPDYRNLSISTGSCLY